MNRPFYYRALAWCTNELLIRSLSKDSTGLYVGTNITMGSLVFRVLSDLYLTVEARTSRPRKYFADLFRADREKGLTIARTKFGVSPPPNFVLSQTA